MKILTAAWLALAVAAGAFAANDAAARKAIEANYNKACAAIKRKDIKFLMSQMTPDCTAKLANGQVMGTKEIEASMKAQFGFIKSVKSVSVTIITLNIAGNSAVAAVRSRLQFVVLDPRNKKKHDVEIMGNYKDTWVKTAKGWKTKRSEVVAERMRRDGKIFDPNKPGSP